MTLTIFMVRFLHTHVRWLLGSMLLLFCTGFQQSEALSNGQTPPSVIQGGDSLRMSTEPTDREAGKHHRHADLLAKAKAHGSVRVIVRLKMDHWRPEGDLPSAQAVAAQREAIAELQGRLLNRMKAVGMSDVKQFTSVPQVAMQVNVAALQELIENPQVTNIWEDVPLAPDR